MHAAFAYIDGRLARSVLINSLIEQAHMRTVDRYVCGAGCDSLEANQYSGVIKHQVDISNTITKTDVHGLPQRTGGYPLKAQRVSVDNSETKSAREEPLTRSYDQAFIQEQENLLVSSSLLQNLRDRLGLRASQHSKSLQELLRDLSDEKWQVRVEAIHGLELLELPIEHVPLNALLVALKDDNAYVRAAVARALGQLRVSASTQSLLSLLGDNDSTVRAAAIQALGCLDADIPNKIFVEALSDGDSAVRAAAITVLGERDDLASVQQAFESEIDETVRLEAAEVLRKWGYGRPPNGFAWLRDTEGGTNRSSINTVPTHMQGYRQPRSPSQQKVPHPEPQWTLNALSLLGVPVAARK